MHHQPPANANLFSSHDHHRLITRRQLQELLPVSTMTIWRLEKAGRLPRHISIGGRSYWRYADVLEALGNLGHPEHPDIGQRV